MKQNPDINIMVGRFQPFTSGHLKCVEQIQKHNGFPTYIGLVSTKKNDERHPFPDDVIIDEINSIKTNAIAGIDIVPNGYYPAFVQKLQEQGYVVHGIVCGTDRWADYERMRVGANKKEQILIDDFIVYEVKRSDEDISATKVRETIKTNDLEAYKRLMPKGTERIFNKLHEIITNVHESCWSLYTYLKGRV